jgi:hypothetical protein
VSPDLEKFRLIVFLGGEMINKYLEIILDVVGVGLDIHKDPDLRFKMIEILHFLVEEAGKSSQKIRSEETDMSHENSYLNSWTVDGVGEKILNNIVGNGLI